MRQATRTLTIYIKKNRTSKKVDRSKQNSAGFAPDFSDKFAFLLKGKSRGFFGFTTKYKMAPMGLNGPHSPGYRVPKA